MNSLPKAICASEVAQLLDSGHRDPTDRDPPRHNHRPTPFVYFGDDIVALLAAARTLSCPLKAATFVTLLGLLASTGMRVGEAIRLDHADINLDAAPRIVDLNLRGTFNAMTAAGRHVAARNSGSIIVFSSVRSQVVEPGLGVYAATNDFVDGGWLAIDGRFTPPL